jgi:hypothetical protein
MDGLKIGYVNKKSLSQAIVNEIFKIFNEDIANISFSSETDIIFIHLIILKILLGNSY